MKAALGETHPLVQLILACLEFDQEDRPSAVVVLRGLEEVGIVLPQNCTHADQAGTDLTGGCEG